MEDGSKRIEKRIAILGGSTTHDIVQILELFLLNAGILPLFYESHYGQYWNDVMFDNSELIAFSPDIVWIHTTCRNIRQFPEITDDIENGKTLILTAFLYNYARHFDISLDYLTGRYNKTNVKTQS